MTARAVRRGEDCRGLSELLVTYCLCSAPSIVVSGGLAAVLLCLGALSGCGALGSVLLSLLAC